MTLVIAALFVALFPRLTGGNLRSFLGFCVFTDKEVEILTARVLKDDATKAQPRRHITGGEVKSAVSLNLGSVLHVLICDTSLPTGA